MTTHPLDYGYKTYYDEQRFPKAHAHYYKDINDNDHIVKYVINLHEYATDFGFTYAVNVRFHLFDGDDFEVRYEFYNSPYANTLKFVETWLESIYYKMGCIPSTV